MFHRKYLLVFGLLVLCIFAYINQASGDDEEKAKKGPKVTDKVDYLQLFSNSFGLLFN